ncbi:MAG: 50S ribosomal protein L32 [Candidatus Levyibacteriota bacterium]|nr:MAG: 50S ribosomal protein L32 [Candidatus Levybacteria bacterium]
MPQEPKKRHSRQRQGKRRASIHLQIPKGAACANCSNITLPHTVCKQCGYYDGRQVLAIKKNKNENRS